MTKALVDGTRIVQVVDDRDQFPVAPPLRWVAVDADVTTEWTYEGNKAKAPPPPPPVPTDAEIVEREIARNPAIRRMVKVLARRLGLPNAKALMDEIKAEP